MPVRIGVDTGGTFTDFVRVDRDRLVVHKVRSTPDDPSRAIVDGLSALASAEPADIIHGSTVATNAVLERRGARVALVATRGFEDVLRIGRQTRPELYNVFVPLPRPIVDPALTFGVVERLDASGQELVPVVDLDLDDLVRRLTDSRAEIVAVCLLHSYANPSHEQQIVERLRRSGLACSASHEVLPEYREFERWSTTVVNAYVTPLIDRYLAGLEDRLTPTAKARVSTRVVSGLSRTRLSIMQSNGGSISAAAARAHAIRTILSGPAAGVVGARSVAAAAGFSRVISFDMGGTSTDVSLIDQDISTTTDSKVGDFPVRLPVIDIETVGAGGGSIAAIDSGGALRVGPRSAGADPGPVCYGRGDELTVTDANLLLGRLDAELFFGGKMKLDRARTERLAADMARRMRSRVDDLAEGIVRVANANMERAIRVVSLQRGHDPRAFTLLAFGGAGGMHACEIAERLGIRSVLIPRHAGVLSALGMLQADVVKDYSAPVLRPERTTKVAELERRLAELVRRAASDLTAEGFGPRRRAISRAVDVRYIGQSYELTVPFTRNFRDEFDRRHERRYGYADRSRETEIVNVRVVAAGLTDKPRLPFTRAFRPFAAKPIARRDGRFGGRRVKVSSFRWTDLEPGARGRGPAVITSGEATAVIPPGFAFKVDGYGNVIAERRI